MNDNVVSTANLGKKYGETWGLKNSTFAIKSKELAVLIGPNGAGKTTTVKILTTFLKPSKGKAEVLGMDVAKDYKKIRKRIAYLPQGFEVNRNLTPKESIKWSLVARGYSLSEAELQAKKWVDKMDLGDCANRIGWTLSGGEKRKVVVAMILAADADVVFLDEPTTGLDVEARHTIWRIVREKVAQGTTILLTTHDMKEGETIADTAVLMNHGETLVQDTPQRLVKSLPYQYRVTVKKEAFNGFSQSNVIDLGDRLIIYAKSDSDVRNIISDFADVTTVLSFDRVGLEDAYLHLIHEGEIGQWKS